MQVCDICGSVIQTKQICKLTVEVPWSHLLSRPAEANAGRILSGEEWKLPVFQNGYHEDSKKELSVCMNCAKKIPLIVKYLKEDAIHELNT